MCVCARARACVRASVRACVPGECCKSGRESSLNIFVLDFASGAVFLSLAEDVVFNVLDLSAFFHHHSVFDLFIFRP